MEMDSSGRRGSMPMCIPGTTGLNLYSVDAIDLNENLLSNE